MTTTPQPLQYLTLSFLCEQTINLMQPLSVMLEQTQCSVLTVKFSYVGHHQTGFFHIQGSWIAIAKLENQLQHFNQLHQNVLHYQRTEKADYPTSMLPYVVQVIGAERPEMLSHVIGFFNTQELLTIELSVNRYETPHTHTPMISIQGTVLIPVDFHLAQIREAFILFCEEQNFDAMFEPDRS